MKVYANQFVSKLRESLQPVYIVSGDEELLVQEACDAIRDRLKEEGYLQRDLFHAGTGFDWSQVLYSANSMSLFAERRILEIRMSGPRPEDKGKSLMALVESLQEETILLCVMPRVDKAVQRTKWFTAMEKRGFFYQVWPVKVNELPAWVNNRFRQAGLSATRDAVRIMVDRIEGNLLAAAQEIERLKLFSEDGKVDAGMVMRGVADSSRYDVFELIDAAVAGNARRVVRIVQGLKLEGVEVLYIVAMLCRELRSLSMMAGIAQEKSMAEALKNGRVWDNRKSLVTGCLQRSSGKVFDHLLVRLNEVDGMVKGVVDGDPWQEITSVSLRLGGLEVPAWRNADAVGMGSSV